ncbi:MAG TPA: dihydroorotate dehydrogenase electron transfer subunit [Bacteroidota bacterium]|nr:dihydroorotate dehydrogenase electron transfer subunit [Bacteroidota bacterium]
MNVFSCRVVRSRPVADSIFVLRFRSPEIAATIRAGQFLNIRVGEGSEPLLRRPFSVYRVEGEELEIVFSVIGRGTTELAKKREGDLMDVLGPLGVPFVVSDRSYDTALLVAGGLGIAPLPILTRDLLKERKSIRTFVGARSKKHLVTDYLQDVHVATDDGSMGFHGTVVDMLRDNLARAQFARPKIFACGPTAMLRSLAEVARARNIACEVSLEGSMACGFGICQGCPVELTEGPTRYALMCKDGPTFDIRRIKI